MATWRSNKILGWTQDMGDDYAVCNTTWQYATTVDTLVITTDVGPYSDHGNSFPSSVKEDRMGRDEALAKLEILLDWCDTYEGSHVVDSIINKIRSANGN